MTYITTDYYNYFLQDKILTDFLIKVKRYNLVYFNISIII